METMLYGFMTLSMDAMMCLYGYISGSIPRV